MARQTPSERRAAHAAVEDPQVVLDAALRSLEARPRSVTELRRRLSQAGYRVGLIDSAVDRLLDLGMLDDGAFARAWVESRDRAHPRSASALRRELRIKGIDDDTARAVLADRETWGDVDRVDADQAIATTSADERAARRLLERKASTLGRLTDPRERRRRAYAMLARAGFDPDICRRVAIAATTEDASDEDQPTAE